VDDVFTTGATVNEAAKILKKEGAGKVHVFTLGRVVVGKGSGLYGEIKRRDKMFFVPPLKSQCGVTKYQQTMLAI
jgi:adenine/guanine phosphoribosyltransferase-like PRPP-binding protein